MVINNISYNLQDLFNILAEKISWIIASYMSPRKLEMVVVWNLDECSDLPKI